MLKAAGQFDACRERLVGDDAGEIGLGLIFRKHALQLSPLVGEVVDKQRRTPCFTKFDSRADIDHVIPGHLPVRTGELIRIREENRIARAGVRILQSRREAVGVAEPLEIGDSGRPALRRD